MRASSTSWPLPLELEEPVPALPTPRNRSSQVLALGAVGATVAAIPAIGLAGNTALMFDNGQQLIAAGAAALGLFLAREARTADAIRVRRWLFAALALALIGLLIWDVLPSGSTTSSAIADVLFAVAIVLGIVGLAPAIFGGLGRLVVAGVALDALLLFLTGVNVVGALWWSRSDAGEQQPEMLALMGAVVLFAGSGAAMFALVAGKTPPSTSGPWAVLAGMSISGLAWIAWLLAASRGVVAGVAAPDFLLSAGLLLIARGAMTWDVQPTAVNRYERTVRLAASSFPILAIVLSVALDVLAPRVPLGVDVVAIGTGAVVLTAAARQALLLHLEQRAWAAERRASVRLDWEVRERAETIVSLSTLEPGDSAEETASRICAEALRLEGIDVVLMHSWSRDGSATLLGSGGLEDEMADLLSHPLPTDRIVMLTARAAAGPWVELVDPGSEDPELAPLRAVGLRGTANAALHWDDRVIGAIGIGTVSEDIARTLGERLPTLREFAVVASALLGPVLVARERAAEVRADIQAVIDAQAFSAVFQPIVDLRTGRTVGFEALTRFDDGCRPDVRFADAAAAGLSIPLETATLRAALRESASLPAGAWLSVNVSPAFATGVLPLVAVLEGVQREVVLEITEHVAIADYERLIGAIALLGGSVRMAVDDAGAGYASLRHILELRPHFLKLDIGLVRSIDSDPARRALVSSMATFAAETRCSVIAEGVETPGELGVLRDLGIELGQGHLLARPGAASSFAGGTVRRLPTLPAIVEHGSRQRRGTALSAPGHEDGGWLRAASTID